MMNVILAITIRDMVYMLSEEETKMNEIAELEEKIKDCENYLM